jgi:hypothetical protein
LRTGATDLPLILVGGGAPIVGDRLRGVQKIVRPLFGDVANAVGAAAAEVGSTIDRIVVMTDGTRADVLARLQAEAVDAAIVAGASPGTIRIHTIEENPVAYAAEHVRRLRIRALGALDAGRLVRQSHFVRN